MKVNSILFSVLIYFCNINADNFIGWDDGFSFRKHIENYIMEISVNPFLNNSRSDAENSDDYYVNSNYDQNNRGVNFSWAVSTFLGRTMIDYNKFKINAGLNLGYRFRWTDRENRRTDDRWSRQWGESHQFEIGTTIRPSFMVFERIILETDYGIHYTGEFTESLSESESESPTLNQTVRNAQYNRSYIQNYRLIGRSFSIDMALKVFLKI